MKRFITRNWITWLQSLRSPEICTQQARASADLTYGSSPSPTPENQESWCKFQPQSQLAQEPIRADESMGLWRLEKAYVPAQWSCSGNYLAFFFYSGHHLIGWVSPTLRRTLCFLLSLWIQMLISGSTLTDIHRMIFDQLSGPLQPSNVDTYRYPSQSISTLTLWRQISLGNLMQQAGQ